MTTVDSISYYKIIEFLKVDYDLSKEVYKIIYVDNQTIKLVCNSTISLYFMYNIKKNKIEFNENLDLLKNNNDVDDYEYEQINIDDMYNGKIIESLFEYNFFDFIKKNFSKKKFKNNFKLFRINNDILKLDSKNETMYFTFDYQKKEFFSTSKL